MKKKALNLTILLFILSFYGCYQPKTLDSYQITHITIAAPGPKNHSFSTAGAISQIFNEKSDQYKLKLAVEPSKGQKDSLESLNKGKVQFALLKSDTQFEAYNGLGQWKKNGPHPKLRTILALYDNPLTLISSPQTRITEVSDLKNRKISLGSKKSHSLIHIQNTLKVLNLTPEDYRSFSLKKKTFQENFKMKLLTPFPFRFTPF